MIVAFYHHPAPNAPMHYDYDAMARRLIGNCLDMNYTPIHLCLDGGPNYGCTRVTFSGDPERIMWARMNAYHEFAQDNEAWFVDTDTVIQKPLPEINADIALTWRPQKILGSHFNGGVMYSGENGAEFFDRCLTAYPLEGDVWGGDQYALTAIAGDRGPGDYDLDGLTLKVIPCDPYNYSPEPGENVSDKVVAHYKGHRKQFMEVA